MGVDFTSVCGEVGKCAGACVACSSRTLARVRYYPKEPDIVPRATGIREPLSCVVSGVCSCGSRIGGFHGKLYIGRLEYFRSNTIITTFLTAGTFSSVVTSFRSVFLIERSGLTI